MNAFVASSGTELIERHEAKYRIPPELVGPIRDVLKSRCNPDSAAPDGRYPLASLYFDTPDRRLYFETKDRAARRYKLRVRRYATGAFHWEVKRRIKGMIAKSRVAVPSERWPMAFHDPRLLTDLSPKAQQVAYDFVNRCLLIDARPSVLVKYLREAWVSRDEEYARVTFDTRLESRVPDGWSIPFAPDRARWVPVDEPRRYALSRSGVVLELKCMSSVPIWMSDLVHQFGLQRSGFSKYAACLEAGDRHPYTRMRVPARRLR